MLDALLPPIPHDQLRTDGIQVNQFTPSDTTVDWRQSVCRKEFELAGELAENAESVRKGTNSWFWSHCEPRSENPAINEYSDCLSGRAMSLAPNSTSMGQQSFEPCNVQSHRALGKHWLYTDLFRWLVEPRTLKPVTSTPRNKSLIGFANFWSSVGVRTEIGAVMDYLSLWKKVTIYCH